jgi:hypothetical protein
MSSSRVFENLCHPSESGRHTMSKCIVGRDSMDYSEAQVKSGSF